MQPVSARVGGRLLDGLYRAFEWVVLFALFAGPPTLRKRDPLASVQGDIDLAAAVQIAVWLLAVAWLAIRLTRVARPPDRSSRLVLAGARLPVTVLVGAALGLLLCVSAPLSPAPGLSLFRAFQVVIACLVAYFLVAERGEVATLVFVRRGLAILCYAIYLAYLIDPALVERPGEYFGIRGDNVAPAGAVGAALLAIALVWPFARRPTVRQRSAPGATALTASVWGARSAASLVLDNRWVLLALSGSLVVIARSRVGLVVAGLSFLAVVPLGAMRRKGGAWLVLPASLVAVLGFVVLRWNSVERWLVRDPNQLSNLSARVPLWDALVSETLARAPWTGLGYVAAARVLGLTVVDRLGNAHSSFVEVLVGGGVLALAVYLGLWAVVGLALVRRFRPADPVGMTMGLLAATVFGYSVMTAYGIHPSPVSFLFWTLLAMSVVGRRRSTAAGAPG